MSEPERPVEGAAVGVPPPGRAAPDPVRSLRRRGAPAAPDGAAPDPERPRRRRRARAAPFLPPAGERLLPALSGLLLVLSFPPFKLLLPPFVALVPFLVFLADRPPGAAGRWSALRGGYLLGIVYFGLLLYWLIVALLYYSALAILAWAVTVAILASLPALCAWGVIYARERAPAVPMAVSPALLWTAGEWIQAHLGDVAFPWLGLGSALTGFPRLAGAADLVGARGLTFWLVLVNGLLAGALLAWRQRRSPVRPALAAALLVAAAAGYGFRRAATIRQVPVARVAVVQPNIPEDLKLNRRLSLDSSLVALTNLTRRIPPGSVDLVVWPEVALQAALAAPGPDESTLREHVRRLAQEARAPILVGAYGYEYVPGRADPLAYNAAFLVTPAGLAPAEYDKQYLVPLVERVPFIDPQWLERITGPLHWFGGLARGRRTGLLPAGHSRFGVLICYESIFAPLSRLYRGEGAGFLVNMTNDSWYGREAFWARTSALWQHPAHLVMRAIENRVGVARAANTGISLFVDPLGRAYAATPLFAPAVRVAMVYGTDERTLFVRWGDWLATLATAAAAALLLFCRLRPPAE